MRPARVAALPLALQYLPDRTEPSAVLQGPISRSTTNCAMPHSENTAEMVRVPKSLCVYVHDPHTHGIYWVELYAYFKTCQAKFKINESNSTTTRLVLTIKLARMGRENAQFAVRRSAAGAISRQKDDQSKGNNFEGSRRRRVEIDSSMSTESAASLSVE